VLKQLEKEGALTTPLGRRRQFWGRLNDASTLREAIAYVPQSTIGDLLNMGLYRVWRELEGRGVQVLGQVHDAILGQVPTDRVDELMPEVINCMTNSIKMGDRELIIPSVAEVGNTWKDLKVWEKHD